jgi:hypothetical protein
MSAGVRFNDALIIAENIMSTTPFSDELDRSDVKVLRDIFGRIRFFINKDEKDVSLLLKNAIEEEFLKLGNYAGNPKILFRDSLYDPDSVLQNPNLHKRLVYQRGNDEPHEIALLENQIVGQSWLQIPKEKLGAVKKVVFHSIKGGVGRSTALAILAYRLAKDGKNVLVIDLDLESPGLSNLLLSADVSATYGVVDWFLEDGVGQGEEILNDITALSPLGRNMNGDIKVVSAMGNGEAYYIDKLNRLYLDLPGEKNSNAFPNRLTGC